jgi:hypothetical protein
MTNEISGEFKIYGIVVFGGFNYNDIVFDGQVESQKRTNLLYNCFKALSCDK